MKKKPILKIYNKSKMLLLLLFIFLFTAGVRFQPGENVVFYQWEAYQVRTGDTLWTLATRTEIPGLDRRTLVEQMKEYNKLEDARIYPGQKLYIPVKKI